MNELSLFSGAGGGLLGSKLLGWKTIGYVEFNDYCQRVLKARIEDGIFDEAPIFGDIRAFIDQGFAKSYTGLVDVLTAGFPCQPFSVAGKQAGEDDPRNMWPETLECLRIIRPRFAFFENVPGLLAHSYGRAIFRDMAKSGYECRWRILSAAELGAPHKRDRLWIQCTDTLHRAGSSQQKRAHKRAKEFARGGKKRVEPWDEMAYSESEQDRGVFEQGIQSDTGAESQDVANAKNANGWWSNDPSDSGWWNQEIRGQGVSGDREEHGCAQSRMGRVAYGVAHRVDRLKAIGNGQVPAVAAKAWEILSGV